MSAQRQIAVLAARHDLAAGFPGLDACREFFLDGKNSIAAYWQENAESWFQFPLFDFYGPYDVALPPPPSTRHETLATITQAARAAGVDLVPYDGFIVVLFPGANKKGVGYDNGATGIGVGAAVIVPASTDHTFACHEFGHMLGFDHSWGISTIANDPGGSAGYGDPYDIMSSATFGGASPTFQLPANTAITGFPRALSAGPMLARAQLHFYFPDALDAAGQVAHAHEGDDPPTRVLLGPSGGHVTKAVQLLVWHPEHEDSSQIGRVYVEYRDPLTFEWASRWDAGLAASGSRRDRRGIIVHVVREQPDAPTTSVVWYAGRIVFPALDSDVRVDTRLGPVTVSVQPESAGFAQPGAVIVRVDRHETARVELFAQITEETKIVASMPQLGPGWTGQLGIEFSWEQREAVTTAVYRPSVSGLGGGSPYNDPTDVDLDWEIEGVALALPAGDLSFAHPEGGNVSIRYSVEAETRVLTVTNITVNRAFTAKVKAIASDQPGHAPVVSETRTYVSAGPSEGWGADYDAFQAFWDNATHPIPIPTPGGPPDPGEYLNEIAMLSGTFERLQALSPEVAARLQHFAGDRSVELRRTLLQVISGPVSRVRVEPRSDG